MPETERRRLLLVDDDVYQMQDHLEVLLEAGYSVSPAVSADDALALAQTEPFDAVVLDVRMPSGTAFSALETAGGYKTGLALARELKTLLPDARFLALTVSRDPEVEAWFTNDDSVAFLAKPVRPRDLARAVGRLLRRGQDPPRVFIVHGRDQGTLGEVKAYLQGQLGFPETVVLAEQPSRGLTLIEKFERYAADSDLAFVLLTPDDVGHLLGSTGQPAGRPRMNVLFELGYFLGALRRRSGRVFVLKKGELEIPSDLAGIVYIDITAGIDAAEHVLRRELADWLEPGAA